MTETALLLSRETPSLEPGHSLKQLLEALLFATAEPLPLEKLHAFCSNYHPCGPEEIARLVHELGSEYEEENKAFELVEIGNGYLLQTKEVFSPYLHVFFHGTKPEKLSHAAKEVLAIVAFKQPITRPQIEAIRGVDSSGTVSSLVERGLIEEAGKLEVPGRPSLFRTTEKFLSYFGLNSISDLEPFFRTS